MNTLMKIIQKEKELRKVDLDLIYHDISQTLRVRGINLIFRKLSEYPYFLEDAWKILSPQLATEEFEEIANAVRSKSVEIASPLREDSALQGLILGESQSYQIQSALDLYHYINPKLLLIASALSVLVDKNNPPERLEITTKTNLKRGVPPRMFPMEMIDENISDPNLQKIFSEIKEALRLSTINSDYRTLALWPQYLSSSWETLRPLVNTNEYTAGGNSLREFSRKLIRETFHFRPHELRSSTELLEVIAEDVNDFEQLLPELIINISLLQLDWKSVEDTIKSPFPIRMQSRSLQ
jgi:hypothetical protein